MTAVAGGKRGKGGQGGGGGRRMNGRKREGGTGGIRQPFERKGLFYEMCNEYSLIYQ